MLLYYQQLSVHSEILIKISWEHNTSKPNEKQASILPNMLLCSLEL